MRKGQWAVVLLGLGWAASLGFASGCSANADDCSLNATCNRDGSKPDFGGVVVPPPGCVDSPSDNSEVIRTECAFFVGGPAASDANDGSEIAPFASLAAAVNAAKTVKARVYLCGAVAERVDVLAGISIFGGFDCTGTEWTFDATMRATITPSAPAQDAPFQSSIRISGAGKTTIEDVDIQAADASYPGGSSIAVIVNEATVAFARSTLKSGNGQDGSVGTTPADNNGPSTSTDPSIAGNDGTDACMGGASGNLGGAGKPNPLCSESSGGKGGTGHDLVGAESGESGLPSSAASGIGGTGEDAVACKAGSGGANGKNGPSAMGATGAGSISPTGYAGVAGSTGTAGMVGQGGGGGGGAKGRTNCYGASGGGGGAGGCAGAGGLGGQAGGASIGLVSINGRVTFAMVDIVVGSAGNGGHGGDGQLGATGGSGGLGGAGAKDPMATDYACDGGKGGRGGNGGMGGGGCGGHALGIAYTGQTTPDTSSVNISTGTAGVGGIGADASGNGCNGVKGPSQGFP